MPQLNDTVQALAILVLDHYLETGKGATVKELAAYYASRASKKRALHLRFSETKIRTMFKDHVPGISVEEARRDSMSKTYSHMTVGSHPVTIYLPTRGMLRGALISASELLRTQQEKAKGLLHDAGCIEMLDTSTALDFISEAAEKTERQIIGTLSIIDWTKTNI